MEPETGVEPEQQALEQYQDLHYSSGEEDEQSADDEQQIVVVKRGITRLHKFRNENGKGVKISLQIDEMGRISGPNATKFASFIGDLVRERVGLKSLSWKEVTLPVRENLWTEITVCRKHFHMHLLTLCTIFNI
jgi:hypothetical protein